MEKKRSKEILTISLVGVITIGLIIGVYFAMHRNDTNVTATNGADRMEDLKIENTNELTVTVYAYCPCSKCNTELWKGMVTRGETMRKYTEQGIYICAVDPNVIPLDSKIIYDGKEYLAKDVGKAIKGNTIDILMDRHSDTLEFGVKKEQKIIIKE